MPGERSHRTHSLFRIPGNPNRRPHRVQRTNLSPPLLSSLSPRHPPLRDQISHPVAPPCALDLSNRRLGSRSSRRIHRSSSSSPFLSFGKQQSFSGTSTFRIDGVPGSRRTCAWRVGGFTASSAECVRPGYDGSFLSGEVGKEGEFESGSRPLLSLCSFDDADCSCLFSFLYHSGNLDSSGSHLSNFSTTNSSPPPAQTISNFELDGFRAHCSSRGLSAGFSASRRRLLATLDARSILARSSDLSTPPRRRLELIGTCAFFLLFLSDQLS